ncbi:MAG TPA: PAS domain S-box protein, partial [Candidatus Thermoplasmatota archaeon]|nr:PAS domain S-box protein [Candidatus Thermoplasmatota archaeon]
YLFDPQGKILYANRAVERITGYTPAEAVGRSVFEFLDPSALETARAHHMAKLEGREERSVYEVLGRRKDGSPVWIEVSSRAVRERGRLVAIQGSLRDVSERYRAALELQASEERYRDLIENANDIIYTHGLDGKFLTVNAVAMRVYGYAKEEFLRMSIVEIVDRAHIETAQAQMKLKLKGVTDRSVPYELLTRAKDGSPVWVEVSTRLLRKDGKPAAIQGIARDITARKAAETIASERESEYRSLVDGVPIGLFRTTPDGRILEANPALLRLLRSPSRDAVVGRQAAEFYGDPSERASLLDLARKGGVLPFEQRVRRLDGTVGWVRGTTRAIQGPDGALLHFEGHLEDITAEKEAQDALDLVQGLAVELNRASDFSTALATTVGTLCRLTGWSYGEAWVQGPGRSLVPGEAWHTPTPPLQKFRRLTQKMEVLPGEGLAGQVWTERRARLVPDLTREPAFQRAAAARAAGLSAGAFVPVIDGGQPVAVLVFLHTAARPEDARWIATAEAAASQLAAVMARRRTEDRLRRQVRLLESQLEAAPDGVLVVSPDGEVLSANRQLLAMCGVEPVAGRDSPALAGRPLLEQVNDPKRFQARVRFLYEGHGGDVTLEGRTFARRSEPLLDEDELPLGRVYYFRDITHERVLAQRLQANKAAR